MNDFKEGQLYLYKALSQDSKISDLGDSFTDLLVDHHLELGDFEALFSVCKVHTYLSCFPLPMWLTIRSLLVH